MRSVVPTPPLDGCPSMRDRFAERGPPKAGEGEGISGNFHNWCSQEAEFLLHVAEGFAGDAALDRSSRFFGRRGGFGLGELVALTLALETALAEFGQQV